MAAAAAAATAQWTVQFRERALGVVARCVRGRRLLATAAALLAPPAHAAGAPLVRARLRLARARGTLWDASVELALAASTATAAELVALRGGVDDNAATPLVSVHRLALSLLQSARGCAGDACDSVQRCYGHLRTAADLLDGPGLHGVDGFLDAERAAARRELKAAKDLALASAVLAITAHWLLH
ncbi:hypothetical protein ACP4OV_022303 [Aristida adscensionis]